MIRNALLGCVFVVGSFACSQNDGSPPADGGAGGSAGNSVTGGAPAASGGTIASTGGTATTTGGAPASGGSRASGGSQTASGGSNAAGESSGGGGSAGSAAGGTVASAGSGGAAGSGGKSGTKSTPIPVKDLPIIEEMPDPLTMNDGTQVTTVEQWKARRQEMIQILEDYTYGHMPPAPGNVKATTVTDSARVGDADYRMLHLTFGPDEKLGFDLGIFTPASDAAAGTKYPIVIMLASSAKENSLGSASAALKRGYAVATVPYQQLGADASNWKSTGFFSAYPDYDWRDFSAWAWGISRAVDYLVTDAAIDGEKIMISGVSRLGQAVLLAGAFDERIALSAPVAGGMAFRFSGKEMGGGRGQGITEVVDQNTYWFGPRLPDFKDQTPRLPSDQHWLPALTAPRLFILCNSFADEYGRAYAAVQSYVGAKPVYDFLGAPQNLGMNFREGGHGMNAEDWSALLDFADQYLLKKAGTRKFDVIPPRDKTP